MYLEECDNEFGNFPYYCEVRWLSHSKLLERYYGLKEEIASFLEEKDMTVPELHNLKWICNLAFSADQQAT